MIKSILSSTLLSLFVLIHVSAGQTELFQTFTDKDALYTKSKEVVDQFAADCKKHIPQIETPPNVRVKTTPWMIYIDIEKIPNIYIPVWNEVDSANKEYMNRIAGKSTSGKTLFGMLFNGFYIPHELGHWIVNTYIDSAISMSYDDEYFANQIAMTWWRKQGKSAEITTIYKTIKKAMKSYKRPIPANVNVRDYYTKNYKKILEDTENFANIYGYMQFSQFVEIYEDKTLPDFDTFLKKALASKRIH